MKRRFFQPVKATARQDTQEKTVVLPSEAPPPKPSSSSKRRNFFFSKHHTTSRSDRLSLWSKSRHTLSTFGSTESNESMADLSSKATDTTDGGTLISRPFVMTPSANRITTTKLNKIDFQTYDSASTSSLHHKTPETISSSNSNNINMLNQLHLCDEDLYRHQLPLNKEDYHSTSHPRLSSEKTPSSTSATTLHSLPLPQQQSPQSRWSVGKISILILACLSLTDILLHMVDAQMHPLESPENYDTLSGCVIRPAFRYHNYYSNTNHINNNHDHHRRPSMGLGSAAISSVTTALSPILPFTGGIDLRREDYWTNGWWGSVSSVVEQVRDAFDGSNNESPTDVALDPVLEMPRGGAAVTNTKKRKKSVDTTSSSKPNYVFSSTEPFVPYDDIADLTLQDVAESFRFAVDNTRPDFQPAKFLSDLLPRARKVVDRMSSAVATARGKGVEAPITGLTGQDEASVMTSGDIDALSFCAAMRVFAEWRVLRQVPPGYKGYAVGMTLGQKDIVQNLAKIEQAIHSYVQHQGNSEDDSEAGHVSSPTLRQLLQYEIDAELQDISKLPRLKEKSAGMGLLWVRRQLQYQTAIFVNAMDDRYESTRGAVQSAYDEVYNSYHGWAVQKIFSYSFQAAPDASEIYKYMDLHRLAEVQKEAHHRFLGDYGSHGHSPFRSTSEGMSDNPFDRFGRHIGNEWDKLAGTVVQEWDKLATGVAQLFGQQPMQVPVVVTTTVSPLTTTTAVPMESPVASPEADQVTVGLDSGASAEEEVENYINHEMEKNAYAHIRAYLKVANPLLADLESLFDEFNMNDPTKV